MSIEQYVELRSQNGEKSKLIEQKLLTMTGSQGGDTEKLTDAKHKNSSNGSRQSSINLEDQKAFLDTTNSADNVNQYDKHVPKIVKQV